MKVYRTGEKAEGWEKSLIRHVDLDEWKLGDILPVNVASYKAKERGTDIGIELEESDFVPILTAFIENYSKLSSFSSQLTWQFDRIRSEIRPPLSEDEFPRLLDRIGEFASACSRLKPGDEFPEF